MHRHTIWAHAIAVLVYEDLDDTSIVYRNQINWFRFSRWHETIRNTIYIWICSIDKKHRMNWWKLRSMNWRWQHQNPKSHSRNLLLLLLCVIGIRKFPFRFIVCILKRCYVLTLSRWCVNDRAKKEEKRETL